MKLDIELSAASYAGLSKALVEYNAAQVASAQAARNDYDARVAAAAVDPLIVVGPEPAAAAVLTDVEFFMVMIRPQCESWAQIVLAIPAFAFVQRFTPTEYATIVAAATVNADLAGYLSLLAQHPIVNLDDPRTIAGLELLEGAGILATGRAAQILAP